jgi:hypothetical protein
VSAPRRFEKVITFFGQRAKVACDGRCDKAWGLWGPNARPRVQLGGDDDPDDYAWLADDEVGEAPIDPGTYEHDHGKPVGATGPEHMNKWCVRACERCVTSDPGKWEEPLALRDFSRRFYNRPPHTRD